MKVILKASEIPLDEVVTKVGGTKKYILKDVVKILGVTPMEIKTDKGCRILFPLEMSPMIDTVSGDTELLWDVEPSALLNYLYDITEGMGR